MNVSASPPSPGPTTGTGFGGQSARRIVTTATSGARIASWGLIRAAITVQIAARSGWSRHSDAQAEQQEDDAERVDLAPEDRVEPGHRVGDDERRADEGGPLPDADLAGHRPDEPGDGDVGRGSAGS